MQFLSSNDDEFSTENIEAELDGIGLVRVDEVASVPRPGSVETFYVEEEIAYRSEQQVLQWQADGVAASRDVESQLGGLNPQVGDLEQQIDQQREVVTTARTELDATVRGLGHHVRRPAGAAKLFYARLGMLVLGDVAGVASASINFGVVPWMAVLQAVAIGAAATTAGLAGSEWKDLQRARDLERDPGELTEDEQRFAQLFSGPRAGVSFAKVGILVAASVLLLIFGGVFAVQAANDGLTAAVLFGCLGAAIGLASAVNYWSYADYIADVVNNAKVGLKKAEDQLERLSEHEARAVHGRVAAEQASIHQEYELRGQAARLHMLALGKKVMRNNTGVVGHGLAPDAPHLGREALQSRNGHDAHSAGVR